MPAFDNSAIKRKNLNIKTNILLTQCVEPAKKRASPIPIAFGMCVEAFFCLDFLFLFHLRKKKEESDFTIN
jgi:hypothetical protein